MGDLRPDSLLANYELNIDDADAIHWRKILDLESASEIEPDWYSTRTFEIFLDALDINQPPVIAEDKNNRTKSSPNGSSEQVSSKCKVQQQQENATQNDNENHRTLCHEKSPYVDETILSAEALKILSELPDLSHMSTTRSFIFPNGKKAMR